MKILLLHKKCNFSDKLKIAYTAAYGRSKSKSKYGLKILGFNASSYVHTSHFNDDQGKLFYHGMTSLEYRKAGVVYVDLEKEHSVANLIRNFLS